MADILQLKLKRPENYAHAYHQDCNARYNGLYAKAMKNLEIHFPMIDLLISFYYFQNVTPFYSVSTLLVL